jgi:TPR repeat protein
MLPIFLARGRSASFDSAFAQLPIHYSLIKSQSWTLTAIQSYLLNATDTAPPAVREVFKNATANSSLINVSSIARLAKAGLPAAIHVLGELNLYGSPIVPQNITKAKRLFKKAAKQNFTESLARLAFLYRYGVGVRRDGPKEAIYRDLSCIGGSAYGCLARGFSHVEGTGAPRSMMVGIDQLFVIAECLVRMHALNQLPLNVPERLPRHLRLPPNKAGRESAEYALLEYTARMGHAPSEVELARVLYYGRLGQPIDLGRARELFARHPEDANALVHLGKIYHLGEGVPVDRANAEHYYGKAAEMGDANGLNNLGILKQNAGEKEAGQKLVEDAAAAGHESALFNLASETAMHGQLNESIKPMRDLASRGMLAAQYNLARILTLANTVYDPVESCAWLRAALKRGPWLQLAETAEAYWRAGNHGGALLVWMELADCGHPEGAHNAALALLELTAEDLGLDDELRKKLAVVMLKKLSRLSSEDISAYMFKAYLARGKPEKARQRLLRSKSSLGFYRAAESHLDGQLPMSLRAVFGNLSAAIRLEQRYILPVMALAPKITLGFFRYLGQCQRGECSASQIADIRIFFTDLVRLNTELIATCLGILAVVVLGRQRLAYLYMND